MYAIVEIAGHQYKVRKDQQVYVNRLEGAEGDQVAFDRVLLTDKDGNVEVGAPVIDGLQVEAKILTHLKADKVMVFKKKRRKGYQKLNGHRQAISLIEIMGIGKGSGKPKAQKAEATKTAAPKKEAAKVEAPKKESPSADLESKTVAELREMAKEKGLTGYSSLKKAELIAALNAE